MWVCGWMGRRMKEDDRSKRADVLYMGWDVGSQIIHPLVSNKSSGKILFVHKILAVKETWDVTFQSNPVGPLTPARTVAPELSPERHEGWVEWGGGQGRLTGTACIVTSSLDSLIHPFTIAPLGDVASGLAVISGLCAGFSLIAAWAETYLRIACLQTACQSIRPFHHPLGRSVNLCLPPGTLPQTTGTPTTSARGHVARPTVRRPSPATPPTDPGPLPDSLFCQSAPSYSRQGDGVSCGSSL